MRYSFSLNYEVDVCKNLFMSNNQLINCRYKTGIVQKTCVEKFNEASKKCQSQTKSSECYDWMNELLCKDCNEYPTGSPEKICGKGTVYFPQSKLEIEETPVDMYYLMKNKDSYSLASKTCED